MSKQNTGHGVRVVKQTPRGTNAGPPIKANLLRTHGILTPPAMACLKYSMAGDGVAIPENVIFRRVGELSVSARRFLFTGQSRLRRFI